MSEVEKMYENAHIEKVINHECTYDYGITCPNDNDTCENCGYYKEKDPDYPPFTAEKQLELIKFLFHHNVYYDVDTKGNYWFHISDDCYTYYYSKFEIALANIINEMWQDLTEEEKQEIKRILT